MADEFASSSSSSSQRGDMYTHKTKSGKEKWLFDHVDWGPPPAITVKSEFEDDDDEPPPPPTIVKSEFDDDDEDMSSATEQKQGKLAPKNDKKKRSAAQLAAIAPTTIAQPWIWILRTRRHSHARGTLERASSFAHRTRSGGGWRSQAVQNNSSWKPIARPKKSNRNVSTPSSIANSKNYSKDSTTRFPGPLRVYETRGTTTTTRSGAAHAHCRVRIGTIATSRRVCTQEPTLSLPAVWQRRRVCRSWRECEMEERSARRAYFIDVARAVRRVSPERSGPSTAFSVCRLLPLQAGLSLSADEKQTRALPDFSRTESLPVLSQSMRPTWRLLFSFDDQARSTIAGMGLSTKSWVCARKSLMPTPR